MPILAVLQENSFVLPESIEILMAYSVRDWWMGINRRPSSKGDL